MTADAYVCPPAPVDPLVEITQARDAFSKECGRLNGELARVMRQRDEAIGAIAEALHHLDVALGDTDPPDEDHPLLLACQALSAALTRAEARP